jgi:pheromone shutdown protein TraB
MDPGAEMKTALELAKKYKLQAELIDQPIKITLARFSKSLTWREKYRFVEEIVLGLLFPKRQMKKLGFTQFDLRKVPSKELIEKMMKHFQERYPSVYKALVEERNKYMIRQLVRLMKEYPEKKILAVVGAGHEKGMRELLLKVEVVR